MNRLHELLLALTALAKENEYVEFKQNNARPQEIGAYISALSNSACIHGQTKGYLVFGVEDTTHAIVGTKFKVSQSRVGQEELENWLAHQLEPRINFRLHEFQYTDKPVVIVEIDAAPSIPVRFSGKAWVRIGSNNQPLDDYPEKARLIWTNREAGVFEIGSAMDGATDFDVMMLLDVRKYSTLNSLSLNVSREALLFALEQDKLIVKTGNLYSITNLGAITFATQLKAFPGFEKKGVRVIHYKGKDRLATIKEQPGVQGYAAGFEGLIDYINDRLPENEEIGRALRVEVKSYPEIAIRELVANALIHQDLVQSGTSPMIEIFSDRIEITNIGLPLISPDRFIDQPPVSRNELLAGLMKKVAICEERGSGIDKVIAAAELYTLPAPDFKLTSNHTKAILYGPKPLSEMDPDEKVRACYQHAALKAVSHERMTNSTLRQRFNIPAHNAAIASRIINDTLKEGLIRDYDPENKSRKTRSYLPFWA